MTMQPRTLVREMSIQRALEWAFGAEKAQIDFDQTGAHEFDRIGVDPLWRGMQLAILGTAVDGGGTSDPHPDAQIIASVVESVLPRRMALTVAELARAGRPPDWNVDAAPRVVPANWIMREDGTWEGETRDTQLYQWRDSKYRQRQFQGRICPVRYVGGAPAIGAARRAYLDWYGALLELMPHLSAEGVLHSVKISRVLPPMTPWIVDTPPLS